MKIALIGYGKMGKAIENIALERGHEIVLTIDVDNMDDFNTENLKKCDVAIEFTGPSTAYNNIMKCMESQIPTISGSTGWHDKIEDAEAACFENNTALLIASNFSLGMNIFFEINKKLAQLMNVRKEYDVFIEETHHKQKLDSPSGTAITLAEQILVNNNSKSKWIADKSGEPNELSIYSKRIDPAPGIHTVVYTSDIDDIEIKHTAHSRVGFALGAVLAAEFICGKQGLFSMKDVLNHSF